MKKMSETIIFFGSGPVSAQALSLLISDFEIEAVITKPRPPHHKGDYPVLEVTQANNLNVLTAGNKAELSELFKDKPVSSRIGLVLDYGLIITSDVIDYFPLGIVNSHFSLLPRWRGADPISFAILSGDKETGVSLMLIDEALDEGPVLAMSALPLDPKITTPELTNKLITLSHKMLVETLPSYIKGQIKPVAQTGKPSYSRKLTKEDGILDFNKPAKLLEREIRAFAGWPRSRTRLGKTEVVITEARVIDGRGKPGTLWKVEKQIGIFTSEGVLIIDRLIPAGKKEMPAQSYLAGYQLF